MGSIPSRTSARAANFPRVSPTSQEPSHWKRDATLAFHNVNIQSWTRFSWQSGTRVGCRIQVKSIDEISKAWSQITAFVNFPFGTFEARCSSFCINNMRHVDGALVWYRLWDCRCRTSDTQLPEPLKPKSGICPEQLASYLAASPAFSNVVLMVSLDSLSRGSLIHTHSGWCL